MRLLSQEDINQDLSTICIWPGILGKSKVSDISVFRICGTCRSPVEQHTGPEVRWAARVCGAVGGK